MPKQNIDLLNSLYKTAAMGTFTIQSILPKVENPNLREELSAQLDNYHTETKALKEQIFNEKGVPEDIGNFTKFYADLEISVSTMKDCSPSHIAEMIIKGSNMGILDVQKNLNACSNPPPDVKKKANAMLKQEQEYINKMKSYL
ncbi:MAG: hypothetical protein RR540_03910 [Oscillospiraceae bacterium]